MAEERIELTDEPGSNPRIVVNITEVNVGLPLFGSVMFPMARRMGGRLVDQVLGMVRGDEEEAKDGAKPPVRTARMGRRPARKAA